MSPAFRCFLAAPVLLISYLADFVAFHAYYAAKAIAGEQDQKELQTGDDDSGWFV